MKLLTWNVAGRTGVMDRQAEAVARREPDVVCLQEVRASTASRWREALGRVGLGFAIDSGELAPPRRLFNLTACRWEVRPLLGILAPQPERVFGGWAETPWGELEIWNAHIPPAPSNGLVKVETCELLFAALARTSERHRILCGDLNSPRYESEEGEVETFGSNHPDDAERWDAAERSLLLGLADWDLTDVFRSLNGYGRRDISWVLHTRARRKHAHRLDHVLASSSLGATYCDYVHEWREAGLSDHSAMEALFAPRLLAG
ncbi:MAG: endonuclease/exonuclease/phosphatase family protein [Actinomycetota bacterium]|nr:endonuclease/exonuclease/phosphatase family protein [Actinomycetota bacterium]